MMKIQKIAFLGIAAAYFTVAPTFAQDNSDASKNKGKVKMVIVKDGKTQIIEEEFTASSNEDLEKRMEEVVAKIKKENPDFDSNDVEKKIVVIKEEEKKNSKKGKKKKGENENIFTYKTDLSDEKVEIDSDGKKEVIIINKSADKGSKKEMIFIDENGDKTILDNIDSEMEFESKDGKKHIIINKEIESGSIKGDKEKEIIIIKTDGNGNEEIKIDNDLQGNEGKKVIIEKRVTVESSIEKESSNPTEKRMVVLEKLKGTIYKLDINLKEQKPVQITIKDENEKLLYEQTVEDYNGSYSKEIDLKSEVKSITLEVTQGKTKAIQKLMFK